MMLLRAGKDPRQVQRRLGHSQLTTTMNVYVHELDDGLAGGDALDEVLWGHPGGHRPSVNPRKRRRAGRRRTRIAVGRGRTAANVRKFLA